MTDPEAPAPSADEQRLAALERRVAELEGEADKLRSLLEKKITSPLRTMAEKFEPKMVKFSHYPPRDLRVDPSYAATTGLHTQPTIAIVSPSLNQAPFIGAMIDSVLNQNYPSLKFHIQDGGSSDATLDILRRYEGRISWTSAKDNGQAHAVNLGFRKVEGEIMAYLNSDDLLLPGTLHYVAGIFAANPKLDVVYSHRICIDDNGREIGRWILPRHDAGALRWFDYVPQETLFWRRRAWDAVGGLDEGFHYALDWDLILRMQAKGRRFKRLPRFLGCFRVHDAQKTTRLFSVGTVESQRLRLAHLGFTPTPVEIRDAMSGYLRRHVLYHRLYKLKVLRY
jgi:glycosyltransferase involved in cell wall biosynthesis